MLIISSKSTEATDKISLHLAKLKGVVTRIPQKFEIATVLVENKTLIPNLQSRHFLARFTQTALAENRKY